MHFLWRIGYNSNVKTTSFLHRTRTNPNPLPPSPTQTRLTINLMFGACFYIHLVPPNLTSLCQPNNSRALPQPGFFPAACSSPANLGRGVSAPQSPPPPHWFLWSWWMFPVKSQLKLKERVINDRHDSRAICSWVDWTLFFVASPVAPFLYYVVFYWGKHPESDFNGR